MGLYQVWFLKSLHGVSRQHSETQAQGYRLEDETYLIGEALLCELVAVLKLVEVRGKKLSGVMSTIRMVDETQFQKLPPTRIDRFRRSDE